MRYLMFVLALYAFPASACQLAGKYRTFSLDPQGGYATTESCQINVNANGRVRGSCKLRDEFGGTERYTLTGGRWRISDCVIKGTLKTKTGRTKIEAVISGDTIVGRAHGGGALALFAGVKVP